MTQEDAAARQYVIAVVDRHLAIGPFDSEDAAQTYLKESGTELPGTEVPVLRVLGPVDPPNQDADLNR